MYTADHERYRFAEQLYCFTDKTMPQIAELAEIPLRTLYRRARDYKWEILRRAARRSPMILVEEMYRELSDLTESINNRPEGQRIPTPQEAELRRKIVYSIAAIKKWPTHAEAAFILKSLLRYNEGFHDGSCKGLESLVDGFLAHRDIYGFASYQPEHNQDINQPTEQEIELLFSGPEDGERPSTFRDPEEMKLDMGWTPPIDMETLKQMAKERDPSLFEPVTTDPMMLKHLRKPNSATGAGSQP